MTTRVLLVEYGLMKMWLRWPDVWEMENGEWREDIIAEGLYGGFSDVYEVIWLMELAWVGSCDNAGEDGLIVERRKRY